MIKEDIIKWTIHPISQIIWNSFLRFGTIISSWRRRSFRGLNWSVLSFNDSRIIWLEEIKCQPTAFSQERKKRDTCVIRSRRAMMLVASTAHSATKYRPGSAMTFTDLSKNWSDQSISIKKMRGRYFNLPRASRIGSARSRKEKSSVSNPGHPPEEIRTRGVNAHYKTEKIHYLQYQEYWKSFPELRKSLDYT